MERVRDVMSTDPITLDAAEPARKAAELMRQHDVGAVLVIEGGELAGIVTDRDIVVRAIADGRGVDVPVEEICSTQVVMVSPDDSLDAARDRMRKRAVRRVAVVEDGEPVGILSLGDVAIERAPRSPLGRISAAPPNNT
jgi:CBS domain-containing protein